MRKILILISFILLINNVSAIVLFNDNFNDGDYTNNPTWNIITEGGQNVALQKLYPVSTVMNSYIGSNNNSGNGIYNLSWILGGDISIVADYYTMGMYDYYVGDSEIYMERHYLGGNTVYTLWTSAPEWQEVFITNNGYNDNLDHNYNLSFNVPIKNVSLWIDNNYIIGMTVSRPILFNHTFINSNSVASVDNVYFNNSVVNVTVTNTTSPDNYRISRLSPKKREKFLENWFWDLLFLVLLLFVVSYFMSYNKRR